MRGVGKFYYMDLSNKSDNFNYYKDDCFIELGFFIYVWWNKE